MGVDRDDPSSGSWPEANLNAQEYSEPTDATAIEPAPERSVGGTVLLVEDNPEVAEVTVSMLHELGYEVQAVAGPTAALEAIDRQSFDIVISDVVMPEAMNGLALARTLRARKPGLPVLLVTGYSQAAAEAAGEFTVMRKPSACRPEPHRRAHDSGIKAAARDERGAPPRPDHFNERTQEIIGPCAVSLMDADGAV